MTEPWFSLELSHSLKWLSLMSLCSFLIVFPLQGRYRPVMAAVWIGGVAMGALCLAAWGIALAIGQPAHVTSPFFAVGVALLVAFGLTLKPMRQAYLDVEMRRTLASDI